MSAEERAQAQWAESREFEATQRIELRMAREQATFDEWVRQCTLAAGGKMPSEDARVTFYQALTRLSDEKLAEMATALMGDRWAEMIQESMS